MKKKNTVPAVESEEEIQVTPKKSKATSVVSTIVNVVLIIAIILAAISTYVSYVSTSGSGVPSILGVRVFSVQTDSMYPILKPGDMIFDTAVKDPAALEVGDIITYWTIINGEHVLNTHKIHQIFDGGEHRIFATKGENNQSADPMTVHESKVVGIYRARIPGLGKVFDYLQTSKGFLIVVVVPVFIFFLFHLVQFFRVLFEYQNVKNRIKYEQERGRIEDELEKKKSDDEQRREAERAAMEAELREKLKAELMASMAAEAKAAEAPTQDAPEA